MRHAAILLSDVMNGGAQRILLQLAEEFADRGIRTDVLVATGPAPVRKSSSRMEVLTFGRRRVLAVVPSLAGYLRSSGPQCLLSTLAHTNIAAVIAHRLARSNARLVLREASTPSSYLQSGENIRERLIPRIAGRFYNRADRVIAVSKGVADDLIARVGVRREKVVVVPNPVPLEEIRVCAGAPVTHPWFDSGSPPVVISVGRLTRLKDQGTLLAAFARARRSVDARLVLLGEGDQRAALEALAVRLGIAAQVWMPGHVENPYCYLARARLFVLSSVVEGLPNVLLEAMACGVPIVSTDCRSGPSEILEQGRFGTLVPVGDEESMSRAIVSSLQGDRGPRVDPKVLAPYAQERVAARYLEILFSDSTVSTPIPLTTGARWR